jgi:hypothetical protein
MIKVAIELQSGAARIGVAVTAESMERALSFVAGRFPGRNCRVNFPIETEGFFVESLSRAQTVEQPQKLAA